jgi:hypothetical protein
MYATDDEPAFVSPPFPVIFLTVAKVIVAALVILIALVILGVIAVVTIDQFVYSFTD